MSGVGCFRSLHGALLSPRALISSNQVSIMSVLLSGLLIFGAWILLAYRLSRVISIRKEDRISIIGREPMEQPDKLPLQHIRSKLLFCLRRRYSFSRGT